VERLAESFEYLAKFGPAAVEEEAEGLGKTR
jgi:hypothetical protein